MIRRSVRWIMFVLIAVGLAMPVTVTVVPKCGYAQEESKGGTDKPAKKKGKKSKKGEEKGGSDESPK